MDSLGITSIHRYMNFDVAAIIQEFTRRYPRRLEFARIMAFYNTGLDNVHVIFCIYEQEACYVINILYIVTVY